MNVDRVHSKSFVQDITTMPPPARGTGYLPPPGRSLRPDDICCCSTLPHTAMRAPRRLRGPWGDLQPPAVTGSMMTTRELPSDHRGILTTIACSTQFLSEITTNHGYRRSKKGTLLYRNQSSLNHMEHNRSASSSEYQLRGRVDHFNHAPVATRQTK
jgi:hypothetical protein